MYCIAQRAEHIWEGVSSATTRSRPIINTRDEPHADAERYRRLHVIVGDSNMSEYSTFLKVGRHRRSCCGCSRTRAVVLRDMTLENPIRAIREISHDITCRRTVRLANGREVSALDIQREYLDRALRYADTKGLPPLEKQALDMWEHCVTDHRGRPAEARPRGRLGHQAPAASRPTAPSTTCRSATRGWRCIDLQYHDVSRDRSLFYKMQDARPGRADVHRRRHRRRHGHPAPDHPGPAAGRVHPRAKERKRDYTVDWVHLKLNDQAQRTVLCKDPFKSRDERVEKLIARSVARHVPASPPRPSPRVLAERRGPAARRRSTTAAGPTSSPQLIGTVAVGDEVVVNTTAVELGLGTGGWHVVHWNLAATAWHEPGPGHIMKLRYTSLQADAGAAEEHHADDWPAPDLDGRPVVVCGLHSQVACVAAVRQAAAARRSRRLRDDRRRRAAAGLLRPRGRPAGRALLDVTITAGQAFGGDLEAVNVPSALALAAVRGASADVVIVAPGPGVVGTGTALGASALEVAADRRRGRRPRRDADRRPALLGCRPRPRHRGVSRQTLTALGLAPVGPSCPSRPASGRRVRLAWPASDAQHPSPRSTCLTWAKLLAAAGLEVTTMGRSASDDPVFFAVAGAAGAAAGARLGAVPGPDGTRGLMAVLHRRRHTRAARRKTVSPRSRPATSARPTTARRGRRGGESPRQPDRRGRGVDAQGRRRKRKSSPARSAVEWVLVIGGALLVALLIRTFLLAAFYIPSASMVSTLEEGDRVLVNKLSYKLHDVRRGDIVVFERPPGARQRDQGPHQAGHRPAR